MNNIFQTLLYQREKQKDTVLATIVWDDGSAPRGAGSQMLVGAEGLLSGTIGGGAVELRSIQLARALLAGQHVDALYDFKLSRDGELGMACGGDVTVLFTPARLSDRVWDALAAEVLRRVRDRVPVWLVLPLDGAAPHIAETAGAGRNRSTASALQRCSTGNWRPGASITGAPPRIPATRARSSVADMMTSLSSGRRFSRRSSVSARSRSASRLRSWNSSKITSPTPSSSGSS